jgi:hypothetical protein
MKTLLKISLAMMIASSALQAAPKWIDPPQENCTSNGGKVDKDGECTANWENAVQICSSLSTRLPTIDELRKVVTDCGGILDLYKHNKNNEAYEPCYKKKGFTIHSYWSSSSVVSDSSGAWYVNFLNGYDYTFGKSSSYHVRCIKE